MLDRLLQALVQSANAAADELLLEALRVGSEHEKSLALEALIRRETIAGLSGVIELYDRLPQPLQLSILENAKTFHHALRESGRSEIRQRRLAALKLIALSRQGKLAYVLSENMHDSDEQLSKAAVDAMVGLARWVASETHNLQGQGTRGKGQPGGEALLYRQLIDNRTEIESAVARAMDVHRGKHGQELLRAALLLCDWPGSKTLAILHTTKHGGQSPMVRRLQQPPASEHVEAFLLGASHAQLRSHFGVAFSHIVEAPVLDALLRKTHWLKDHQLQLCMHQVSRGAWWGEPELLHDIERRPPDDAARIAEWLSVSGMHDVMQDERMDKLRLHARDDFGARLRLLRLAAARPRGASVQLLRQFLTDPDERLVRLAAREIIRRRPMEYENMLLQLMTGAPQSVRRVVSRAIGHVGFDHFWQRFDRMDRKTRRQAGKAMLKLLPDGMQRLSRQLHQGPIDQRIKALQMVHELSLAEPLRQAVAPLCSHPNARVRSKAISVLGEVESVPAELIVERLINDADARVRANAIEVLEQKHSTEFVPLLAQRARSSHNRERANAIKALHTMKVGTAASQLLNMLRDPRSEHRISALWALRQVGFWQLLNEVGNLAKSDENLRVRRYALGVLRNVAELMQERKRRAG